SEVVVAIATHEMPLVAKVVVNTGHAEVRRLGNSHVGRESLNVDAVAAAAETTARRVRGRHVSVPHLLHKRIDADSTRIAGAPGTLRRRDTVYWYRIQVIGDAAEGQQPESHRR